MTPLSAENQRLEEDRVGKVNWRHWGPYVSERSWGTVREDYSPSGNAWAFFPHDHARSRAYRWGEDGLAGICDRYQLLVFALALWNGRDGILKERLFGLVPSETNHGEDVKEYYFYLDSTPTHSYMKYLYKYPQAPYPYAQLIEMSRARKLGDPEYELLDTGIFDRDRYFDVFVEYAKATGEDIYIRIEVFNRGPEAAPIHVLPHLWFRNTWAWGPAEKQHTAPRPVIQMESTPRADLVCLMADDSPAEPLSNLPFSYRLGQRYLYGQAGGTPLFTDNETNRGRLWDVPSLSRYTKDGFHRHIINGEATVNPERTGTKACIHYDADVPAGGSVVFRLRLTDSPVDRPLDDHEVVFAKRRTEADEFYKGIHPTKATEDEKRVQRQALAGMLWTKQIYLFDVNAWLEGDDPGFRPPESRKKIRNIHWHHLNSMRVLSMPDKWEYPWFAAWDLAFHTIPFALIDPEFAKEQLWFLLFEQFQHPNGQIPAYEWEFSDLNPPVHAWAVWRVYIMDREGRKRRDPVHGKGDTVWLEKCYHKLLINFAWWVNRNDDQGNNVFEGGFLGLDNITVIDRSVKPTDGTTLKQSDATGWMGMFCLNLMRIALELAKENPAYNAMATKFFEHYVYIGEAMTHVGGKNFELWSERDGFFYDSLVYPDGSYHKFRVRSLVGLIPLYAVERLEQDWIERFPDFKLNLDWFLRNRKAMTERCVSTLDHHGHITQLLALVNEKQLRRILGRVWDPHEFMCSFGLRSLSKAHETEPFSFAGSQVCYEPAESRSTIKGGNSNWRGPIWFPTAFLMIESLRKMGKAYGPDFLFDPPPGPGNEGKKNMTLLDLAQDLADRLISIFTSGKDGRRPVHGRNAKFQNDPHWRDLILFYEYFNGDTGEGLGASHQTGWTGLVATLIDEWRK
jgi:hypothetical protein